MSFSELKPKTKRLVIATGAAIVALLIVAAAITGNMNVLLGIIGGAVK